MHNTTQTRMNPIKTEKRKIKIRAKVAVATVVPAAAYIQPNHRKDVLTTILLNKQLPAAELFALIMNESLSASVKGFVYETMCIILIIAKCISGLDYTQVCIGQLQTFRPIRSMLELLEGNIHAGDNPVDIILIKEDILIPISVKYRGKYSETEVSLLYRTIESQHLADKVKVALIVKDKDHYVNHNYRNKESQLKIDHAEVIANNLLFDETDIVKGLAVFCQRYGGANTLDTNNFIHLINAECLLSARKQLVFKLHQKMALLQFEREFRKNKDLAVCLDHKVRSGKSITLLKICMFLLANGRKRILFTTSVPSTIKSFIDDLNKYVELTIPYKTQEDFMTLDKTFEGILFCSVQYLKMDDDKKKRGQLKNIGFDAIVIDESHQGSSTDKTKADIIDADLTEIRENIMIKIFASGTAEKTKKYYGIQSSCGFKWEMTDESYMKQLGKLPEGEERSSIIKIMNARHGQLFEQCLADFTLNRDYSQCPVQVLMKYSIDAALIEQIKAYNVANNTSFGYDSSSLLALVQTGVKTIQTGDIITKEIQYREEFVLAQSAAGIDILRSFFEVIISSNIHKKTIMKQVEATQSHNGSRISTKDDPRMTIVYLPLNGNINLLQKTIIKFLEKYKIWPNWNVEYSNAKNNSNVVNEKEYNDEIASYMVKTRREKRQGCILLLGRKGAVGITYHECDVTISLDNGHSLDNQIQRNGRAGTEHVGKTIAINVDMNIQRTYIYVMDMVNKHRSITKTLLSNAEILCYLFKNNIFMFDPQEFNNGQVTQKVILEYYEKTVADMISNLDDTAILEQIQCNDDMNNFILASFEQQLVARLINRELEGGQQDCPKADKEKTQVDPASSTVVPSSPEDKLTEEEETNILVLKNKTLEMCKKFMFPLLGLISKTYGIPDFKEIFVNPNTRDLLKALLIDKKIDLSGNNYDIITHIMSIILDNNCEIVNNIREIYSTAPSYKLRELIAKHFVPTDEERKGNAEVPTSVVLVNDMLNTIPDTFWQKLNKVFEPCCGKGNFVLALFDLFYEGLADLIPCNMERCRMIMTECLYYGDITQLNVFITTELLKCHIQSYCGEEELDYTFNHYTGDTLELDFESKWHIPLADVAIIGNPPYSTDPSKQDTKPLYDKFIEKYIGGQYLLFVVPSRWFIGGKGLDNFRQAMMKRDDIVFITHEDDSKKWFGNGINIEGGVNYFLKDATYKGRCLFNTVSYNLAKYDCIIDPKYHKIIDLVGNKQSIIDIYCSAGYFKYRTNDARLKATGAVKCYVSLQKSNDRCKYVDAYDFNEKNSFWKVITARANGKSPNFGAKFIGKPNEIYTDSYIAFRVNNEAEAQSLISYLDTKFANYMMAIRKISQDISENTCKWLPIVPFDRVWTEEAVCNYFNILPELYL